MSYMFFLLAPKHTFSRLGSSATGYAGSFHLYLKLLKGANTVWSFNLFISSLQDFSCQGWFSEHFNKQNFPVLIFERI